MQTIVSSYCFKCMPTMYACVCVFIMCKYINVYMTYPLRTPRTKLSIKNDPNMMSGTKYIQL